MSFPFCFFNKKTVPVTICLPCLTQGSLGPLCSGAGWARSRRAGSSLAPREGPRMPTLSWVLGPPVRTPPEAAPTPDLSCGGWRPKWREPRVPVQRGGSGLSGRGGGGAWLQPPLHLGSASAPNPRGAGSLLSDPRFLPQEAIWQRPCWAVRAAGPLQLPSSYAREQGPGHPRMSHSNTVHINSRGFR